jgi:signal transduction histidine kinase
VIRLEARPDAAADEVVIDVVDQGPGIAPEDRSRIFDRFARGTTPTQVGAPSTGGTGIGLAIVRWAVDLHGGRIEVAGADRDQGARMRLTLPVHVPR